MKKSRFRMYFFTLLMLLLTVPFSAVSADLKANPETEDSSAADFELCTNPAAEGIHFYRNTIINSLEIRYTPEIEFEADGWQVSTMSAGGYLMVKDRHLFTTRKLEILPGEDGSPKYLFYVNDRLRDFDENARGWFRELRPEVLRRTGIGAWRRVEKYVADRNFDRAIREISFLGSNSVKKYYYLKLSASGQLPVAAQQRLIREAGKEITSSRGLKALLLELGRMLPPEAELTAELFRSAAEISSGSGKAETLIGLARQRKLTSRAAVAALQTARTISSAGEKSRALQELAAGIPVTDEAIHAYLKTAGTVSSAGQKADALIALTARADLTEAQWSGVAETAETVASASGHSRVLRTMAARCPVSDAVVAAYLQSAASVSSSGARAEAILALLQRDGLSETACADIATAVRGIASSAEQTRVLKKLAGLCPLGGPVVDAYLRTVNVLSSSSGQEAALIALLNRPDLSRTALKKILEMANSGLRSEQSRQMIVARVQAQL